MAAKGEKTREAILDASYGLFAAKGFKQVTMKDVCEVTNMSRGGLYSHFSGTEELFEAILNRSVTSAYPDFQSQIDSGVSAISILQNTFDVMEKEMMHPENSLSAAIYEYADTVNSDVLKKLNRAAVRHWSSLIRYGISTHEFLDVDVDEIVNIILFSYQGARMWSRIIDMKRSTFRSITNNIMRQLTGVE